MSHVCQFCNGQYKSAQILRNHQQKARYCLEIQRKLAEEKEKEIVTDTKEEEIKQEVASQTDSVRNEDNSAIEKIIKTRMRKLEKRMMREVDRRTQRIVDAIVPHIKRLDISFMELARNQVSEDQIIASLQIADLECQPLPEVQNASLQCEIITGPELLTMDKYGQPLLLDGVSSLQAAVIIDQITGKLSKEVNESTREFLKQINDSTKQDRMNQAEYIKSRWDCHQEIINSLVKKQSEIIRCVNNLANAISCMSDCD